MTNETLFMNGNLFTVVLFALIIRWSVSLHSYSGEKSPPMFGDYEAQRHWMEITVNLPSEEWYFNSSSNDLLYWGLDYPPLTAYHSFVNGKISHFINPEYVKLFASRGFESYEHKFFMRTTVILTDVIIYFTSVILFFRTLCITNQKLSETVHGEVPEKTNDKSNCNKAFRLYFSHLLQVSLALLYPGLILIDHGHFQYNSVSLGLTVASLWALLNDKFIIATILFSSAVNYKQMSLYHSLPMFFYIFSHCLPNKKQNWSSGCRRLLSVSFAVIITFWFIWFPFFKNKDIFFQVLKRLFPISRGIYEDKVSNFWCTLNIVLKLNKTFSQLEMTKLCIICVLLTSVTSIVNLFRHPTIRRLLLSLINVSLSFFLFSYQVHEKSILLVAVPVLLYFPIDPFPCFWFSLISTFSMLPLFIKDNLILPFISLTSLYSLFVFSNITFPTTEEDGKIQSSKVKRNFYFSQTVNAFMKIAFILSLFGCVILFLCIIFIDPPLKYPDFWPQLISVYSFVHFAMFLIYFNYIQIIKLKAFE